MDQDAEVADFLRDFVKHDGDSGREADRNTDQITRSDNQSINEIMHGISDQIHDRKRMHVCLGNRHMAVISVDNFFGNQSKKYSCENKYWCPESS